MNKYRYFERWVLFIIFLNSIFLASFDYQDPDGLTLRNQIINISGTVFTVLFTIEMLCRLIASGLLLHDRAYLRNGWSWLDIIVVTVGWLEFVPGIPSLRALRTFRVIRPLRAINSIPSLKKQVLSLLKSLG